MDSDSKLKDIFQKSFGHISEDATLADAKRAMETVAKTGFKGLRNSCESTAMKWFLALLASSAVLLAAASACWARLRSSSTLIADTVMLSNACSCSSKTRSCVYTTHKLPTITPPTWTALPQ